MGEGDERSIATVLAQIRAANASAGVPVVLSLGNRSLTLSSFVFDSALKASEIWIKGEAGAEIRADMELASTSASGRRSLQHSAGDPVDDPALLFTVRDGAPRIIVQGLRLLGRLRVEGGELTVSECTLSGANLASTAMTTQPALRVSGGSVLLNGTVVADHANGGIEVSGGDLSLERSACLRNGRGSETAYGAIQVIGGSVDLANTRLEENGRDTEECVEPEVRSADPTNYAGQHTCVRGGALRLVGGSTTLRDGTYMKRNLALEGSSLYVHPLNQGTDFAPSLVYRLPTPLGHYVVINNGGTRSTITTSSMNDHFPFECKAGRFGINTPFPAAQSGSRCTGLCPAGHKCPMATVHPMRCANGTYCPAGSAVETDCPAGTVGDRDGLESAADCRPCRAGSSCLAGSAVERDCSPGTFAARSSSHLCDECSAGTYQDEAGQTSCNNCPSGRFCPRASVSPQLSPARVYANAWGLADSTSLLPCPSGFYCPPGCIEPNACPAGTFGLEGQALAVPEECISCTPPSSSGEGSTACPICLAGACRSHAECAVPTPQSPFACIPLSSADRYATCACTYRLFPRSRRQPEHLAASGPLRVVPRQRGRPHNRVPQGHDAPDHPAAR